MKVLVVGGGGREHALVWKLAQSPRVTKLYAAPGNAGIAGLAECVPIAPSEVRRMADFAQERRVDLTVVGPEEPLTLGVVDEFEARGLRAFGPSRAAAELEGSKAFAKGLMKKYRIPTGYFQSFDRPEDAHRYVDEVGPPLVVKADGLAAGKGVILCRTGAEGHDAVKKIMEERVFADAGARVVIEEFLEGQEASFFAFTDAEHVVPMPSAQDHKAIHDDDQGPNTGGMGAYSPAPIVTPALQATIMDTIMLPTVRAMAAEGRPFRGFLYAGLMIREGVPRVLEFNARFGDPEAQVLLMRLETDLVEIIEAVHQSRLQDLAIRWRPEAAVCVVMASAGYPGPYERGRPIADLTEAEQLTDVTVFHAGTARDGDRLVTAGGRVLGVTALGADIPAAIRRAYEAVECTHWEGHQYRRDIGRKALTGAETARLEAR